MILINSSKQKNSTRNLFYKKRKKNHKNNAVVDLNVIYSACHWEERFSQLRKDILLVTLHFLPNCILFNYLSKSQKTKKEMKINYTFPHFLLLVSKMCVGRVTSKFGSAPTQLLIRYLSKSASLVLSKMFLGQKPKARV